jgi:hypothetical protein
VTLVRAITMQLFKRSCKAKERWHKKALFVNFSKARIVLEVTTEPEIEPPLKNMRPLKRKHDQSWTPAMGPHSEMEELLKQEQYGLLGFFGCR